ncbi:helix-turn-helix domain-containing protein [Candidatus Pacearchaeota archaeon]|nr:helix-turn-helix domain-containing protein [Candidatus Pacearchaeota archaeon]
MKKIMPQEIEVWYLLPALRREIAKTLINKNRLSQKEAAKVLGITEPAISQYLNSKRGKEMIFSKKELIEIEKMADKISRDPKKAMDYLYKLSVLFRGTDVVCRIHKKHDLSISPKCRLCANE